MSAVPDNPALRRALERAAADEGAAAELSSALRDGALLVAAEKGEPLRYAAARSPQGRTVLLAFSGPGAARAHGDVGRVIAAGVGELVDIAADVGAEGVVVDLGSAGGVELPLETLRVVADGGVPVAEGRYREPGGVDIDARPPTGRFAALLSRVGGELRRVAPDVVLLAYQQRVPTGVWNATLGVVAGEGADADRAARTLAHALPRLLGPADVVDVRALPASFAEKLAGVAIRLDRERDGPPST